MNIEIRSFKRLNFILRFPTNYEQGKRYPAILLLHGAGSRGTDIEVLRRNPYFTITDKYEDFPFVTVAPQCCENTWFDLFDDLKGLAAEMSAYDFVDPARVYVMGPSMGGYATWQLAMSIPDAFAAAVPICGGGMYWNTARLKDLPVWAFHGALDATVLPRESEKLVESTNSKGGCAKLTVYPDCAHDAWSNTYSNPEVFEWLLSHVNKKTLEFEDEYKGSAIYG